MKKSLTAQKSKNIPLDKLMNRSRSVMSREWIKSNLSKLVAFLLSNDEPAQAPQARPDVAPSLGRLASPLVDPTGDKDVLVKIAHALIQFSLEDGDHAATEAAKNMASVNARLLQIDAAIDKLCGANEKSNVLKAINEAVKKTVRDTNEAMVELQFFDRVSQRMAHSMAIMQIVHGAELNADSEQHRKELLRKLYTHLTMEDERVLFNAIQTGESIQEAVEKAYEKLQTIMQNSNVHIF